MKKYILLIIALLLNSCQEISEHRPLLTDTKEKQPIFIVNQNRHLNISEFWINQIVNPDKLIMNQKDIREFNNEVAYTQRKLTYFKDVNRHYGSSWVKKSINKMLNEIKSGTKFFGDANQVAKNFYTKISRNIDSNSIQKKRVKTRYALTVNYTNQKIIPTELALLKKKKPNIF